jgi:hypothetical protein
MNTQVSWRNSETEPTTKENEHLITFPWFIRIKLYRIKVVQVNLKTNTVKIKEKGLYKLNDYDGNIKMENCGGRVLL